MNSKVHEAVTALRNSTSYYPCLLLVHPRISELEAVTRRLVAEYAVRHLSLGRELTAVLVSVPLRERGHQARRWLENASSSTRP